MRGFHARLAVLCAAGAVAGLMGPAATWLQGRAFRLPDGVRPDTVYVLAGGRRRAAAAAELGYVPLRVLTGNDAARSSWSSPQQRNLTAAEWSVAALQAAFADAGAPPEIRIVPGRIANTDDEMQALAAYCAGHPEIRAVVLVTSPFHVRRAMACYRRHNARPAYAAAPRPGWRDRLPWVVLLELAKLGRDRLGLTHAPLLSRPSPRTAPSPVPGAKKDIVAPSVAWQTVRHETCTPASSPGGSLGRRRGVRTEPAL
jgi:hypothetical protein